MSMQPTLGELVNTLPGINSSLHGPNASRPVIRGLDEDRVQILQNGLASFDASGTVSTTRWASTRSRCDASRSCAAPPRCSTAPPRSAAWST
ncbi:MAG: TonB-dependent receptor plug domain-containing protein [Burkholderiales bacterium]